MKMTEFASENSIYSGDELEGAWHKIWMNVNDETYLGTTG
jgi:hypothetical protein